MYAANGTIFLVVTYPKHNFKFYAKLNLSNGFALSASLMNVSNVKRSFDLTKRESPVLYVVITTIGVAKVLPQKHLHKLIAKNGYVMIVAKQPFHFIPFPQIRLKILLSTHYVLKNM